MLAESWIRPTSDAESRDRKSVITQRPGRVRSVAWVLPLPWPIPVPQATATTLPDGFFAKELDRIGPQ
jgi:hypothetical protein